LGVTLFDRATTPLVVTHEQKTSHRKVTTFAGDDLKVIAL
jgi:hypothetical protein